MTSPRPVPRRHRPVVAVLMLLAASMAGVAATGAVPVLFVTLMLVFTVAAALAVRRTGRLRG